MMRHYETSEASPAWSGLLASPHGFGDGQQSPVTDKDHRFMSGPPPVRRHEGSEASSAWSGLLSSPKGLGGDQQVDRRRELGIPSLPLAQVTGTR
eukprot:2459501-Amphidinium_carterae.1